MISVSEIIEDDDLAQDYTIYRSNGSWVNGRWVEGTPTQIPTRGTISVMSAREMQQVPEGDRIRGAMVFHSRSAIYVTRTGTGGGISDKIQWGGNWYKIFSVSPYGDYGYYKAYGERIKGS